MSTSECCLCAQLAGDPTGDLLHAQFGGPYEQRARALDRDLVLIPSLGSLVPGHVLVCPNTHVRSFAQLDGAVLSRVPALLKQLTDRLGSVTGSDLQLFEHGDAKRSSRVSCSVEHAHLHIVPGVPDLWPAARRLASWTSIASPAELPSVVGDGEYLALLGRSGGWRVAPAPPLGHPSQLLRRLIADALGRAGTWNWREYPALDATAESWRIVQQVTVG